MRSEVSEFISEEKLPPVRVLYTVIYISTVEVARYCQYYSTVE